MKETNHNYQNALCGNFYCDRANGEYNSWEDFKNNYLGFESNGFDDTYHFVFRYDITKVKEDEYYLELCIMLQRKGIYSHIYINDINQHTLNTEIAEWLKGRAEYMKSLWKEVI